MSEKVIPIGREKIHRHRSYAAPGTGGQRTGSCEADTPGSRKILEDLTEECSATKPLCLFQVFPREQTSTQIEPPSSSADRNYEFMGAEIMIKHIVALPLMIFVVKSETSTISILVDNRTGGVLQKNLEQARYPNLEAFIRHVVRLAARNR